MVSKKKQKSKKIVKAAKPDAVDKTVDTTSDLDIFAEDSPLKEASDTPEDMSLKDAVAAVEEVARKMTLVEDRPLPEHPFSAADIASLTPIVTPEQSESAKILCVLEQILVHLISIEVSLDGVQDVVKQYKKETPRPEKIRPV